MDEIPNSKANQKVLENFESDEVYHFAQRLFYCYLNVEEVSGKHLSQISEFEGIEKSSGLVQKCVAIG